MSKSRKTRDRVVSSAPKLRIGAVPAALSSLEQAVAALPKRRPKHEHDLIRRPDGNAPHGFHFVCSCGATFAADMIGDVEPGMSDWVGDDDEVEQ